MDTQKYYLLSYPRSGNSWLRYMIEWITGVATIGDDNFVCDTSIRVKDIKAFPIEDGEPFITKKHSMDHDKIDESRGLIFLIRNFKECIPRNAEHKSKFEMLFYKCLTESRDSYISLLKTYDEWDCDRKIIIYYEDLITNPYLEMLRLLIFLGRLHECLPRLQEFFENIDDHHAKSIAMYEKHTSSSITKGKMVSFHESNLPDPKLWESRLRERFPLLYFKYLERYSL